jgi:hypothetical protein
MMSSSRSFGRVFSAVTFAAALASLGWAQNPLPPGGAPQGPPPGGPGRGARGPAATPRQMAPVDFTGTWVSVVTEEWRIRMLTPRKGTDFDGIPMTAAARAAAMAWDPAADEAAGLQCKGYGAPGLMRLPGRARVSWEDDSTLKLEYDTGEQTRLLHFGGPPPAGAQPSWQGYSVAEWELQGPVVARGGFGALGRGPAGPPAGAAGPPAPPAAAGPPAPGGAGGPGRAFGFGPPPLSRSLKVVTTQLRPGYVRKNGVPYSANAVLTEYFDLRTEPNDDTWFTVMTIVEDPENINTVYITSSDFKKEPNGSKWASTPCAAR